MSNVVRHGDTLYLAGQVVDQPGGDITSQTQEVLAKIERLLAANGSSKQQILWCQIFLSDIRFFDEMNAVWDAWVVAGCEPARATLEARLANPLKFIEICVVAALAP